MRGWPRSLLLLVAVTLAAAGGFAWEWRRQARLGARLAVELVVRHAELVRLRAARVAADGNGRAADAGLAQAEAELPRRTQAVLGAGHSAPTDESPLGEWFELAAMAERLRAAAGTADVALEPTERFGFASHRENAPTTDALDEVAGQRRIVEQLVGMLFAARPTALHTVQRERPGRDADGEEADFFEFAAPSGDIRRLAKGSAFRLEFSGSTAALRKFLNAVAESDEPLVVRQVEVSAQPAAERPRSKATNAKLPDAAQPVISAGPARFAVVVEHLSPADPP